MYYKISDNVILNKIKQYKKQYIDFDKIDEELSEMDNVEDLIESKESKLVYFNEHTIKTHKQKQ